MRILALLVLAGSTALAQAPMIYYQAAPVVAGGGTPTATVQRGVGSIAASEFLADVDVSDFDSTHTWIVVQARSDSVNLEDYRYTVDVVDGNTFRVLRGDDLAGLFDFTYSVIEDPGLTVSRYRGTISGAEDTLAVAISSVTTAKTWVYPSYIMDVSAVWDYRCSVSHELESATSIKLRRAGAWNSIPFVLQVVSYDSCTVQRGVVLSPGTGATKDVAITALGDSSKAFAMVSLHSTSAGGAGMNDWAWYPTWYTTGATAVDTMRLVRYDNYSAYRVYYEVVEFTDGSTVTPIHFISNAGLTDVTISAVDTTRASFLGSGPNAIYTAIDNGSNNRPYGMWTYRFNNSTTQVRMQRYGDTGNYSKGKAYVIDWKGAN